MTNNELRKAARVAAAAYLSLLLTGPFSQICIPYRSGFLPCFLGVLLMLACFGWLVLSLIALLLPPYYETAFQIAQPVMFGELAIMLGLLIKGAKVPTPSSALQPATADLVPS